MPLRNRLLGSLLLMLAVSAQAESLPNAPYVSTSGEGRVEVLPDHAVLQVRVERIADEPGLVRERINAIQTQLQAVGERYREALARFELHDFEFGAHREYRQDLGRMVDQGFRGAFRLELEVRELERLDALMFDLSGLELSGLGSPQFAVRDERSHQDQARSHALAAATEQARVLAADAGAGLGNVWGIVYLPMDRLAAEVGRDAGPGAWVAGPDIRFRAESADAGFVMQTRVAPIVFSARVGMIFLLEAAGGD